ncbi:MAG: polyhydroxyalkanoate synthesis regulator DNA-binding domain-containing protein [Candidatus Muiribacteriota bacterium]
MQTILIKKYENRRLYNTTHKKYISLEDIRQLVIDGYDITVVEKKTGKDITKQILFQALIDMSPEKLEAFPMVFLKFLIKSPAPLLNDYFRNFFLKQLDMYMNNREKLLEGLKYIQGSFFSNMQSGIFNNPFTSIFNKSFKEEEERKKTKKSKKTEKTNKNDESESDLNDLKKMMKNMEKKISDLENKKK